MNAVCRQRRTCIPIKISNIGFKNFRANSATKLVHSDKHPIVNEGSEWASKIHEPTASISNLVKMTVNKLQKTQEYDFLIKSGSYEN